MKKANSSFLKKELARCRKNIKTNWRGLIKLKYLLDLYAFAPSDEWTFLPLEGNELMHARKEGRRDAVLYWNAEKKQIECSRMGAVLWYVYCIRNNVPL